MTEKTSPQQDWRRNLRAAVHPKRLAQAFLGAFSFRGRIDRHGFWSIWLGYCTAAFVGQLLAVQAMLHAPFLLLPMQGLAWLVIVIGFAAPLGAMVRRLRDAGRHWWPIPATFLSFFSAFMALAWEAYRFQLVQNGEAPGPGVPLGVVLMAGLIFLASAIWLLIGLGRKSLGADVAVQPEVSGHFRTP